MSGAAKVNFQVTNLTTTVGESLQGINFVQGRSIRGPFAQPDEVINSWPQFVAKYGGLMADSDAPLICKTILEKGASIRFSRVGHYEDITDKSSLDAKVAVSQNIDILTFDEPFVIGNEIEIEVNGDLVDTVNFSLSNENTLKLIANSIAKSNRVASSTLTKDYSGNYRIIVTHKGETRNSIETLVTGGATQPTQSLEEDVFPITDRDGNNLFNLTPKYPGADYNNFDAVITTGSNNQEGYFNLTLTHRIEKNIQESYINLTLRDSKDFMKTMSQSKYFDVSLEDRGTNTSFTPIPVIFSFEGGTDGELPENRDYIGDSNSRTGFFAFDEYDDSYQLTSLDNLDDVVTIAGSAYAKNRGDLVYFAFLPFYSKTNLLDIRQKLGDNKYQYIFGGFNKMVDPITSQVREINPVGDIFALIAESDKNYGEWYSFAGPTRGLISGSLGVNPNFGAPASYKDLDELANRQINMVVNKSGSVKLWGSFTGQYSNDQEKFINILRLLMFLRKSLRPTLESFLEEPNDFPTWKRIYLTVKPFMDSLRTKRAVYDYEWQGDQFETSMNNLKINNATDVGNGKYKVNLMIKTIAPIQEINVNIILAPTGVDFELVSELL